MRRAVLLKWWVLMAGLHRDLRRLVRGAFLACGGLLPLPAGAVDPPRDGPQLRFDGIYREEMEGEGAQAVEHLRFARDGTVDMVRVHHRLSGGPCIDDSARGTYRLTAKRLTIAWTFETQRNLPRAKKGSQSGVVNPAGSVVLRRWWGHGGQWIEIAYRFETAELPTLKRCPT